MRLATFQRLKYLGTGNEFMENNPVFGTGETFKTSTIISRNISQNETERYDERDQSFVSLCMWRTRNYQIQDLQVTSTISSVHRAPPQVSQNICSR